MNQPLPRPQRLYEIDALRGLAALGVAFFHLKVMTAHPGGLFGLDSAAGRWANAYLWTSVDLFFVISGFIFAHVYLRDDRLEPHTTMRNYAVARVARIYPLHLLTLFLVAAIVWSGLPLAPTFAAPVVHYDVYHFALNLLMLQASGIEHGFSFNSPAWSLTSEFICYALFYGIARVGGRWLLVGAVAMVIAGVASEFGLLPIPGRIARALVGFFIGVMVHRYRMPLQRIPLIALVAMTLGGAAAVQALQGIAINEGVLMSVLAWPWLVLLCLNPNVAHVLRTRPLQFLGDLSYSIYLIHIPLGLVVLVLNGGRLFAITQFAWLVPAYLAALLILAWLSFRTFEEPARRKIRSLWSRKITRP